MSPKRSNTLCYVAIALLSILILLVVGIFIFELKFRTNSCGLSAELLEIVHKQNATDADDTAANDPNFDFTGRYRLEKSENFDNFLEELGVGYLQRTIANKAQSEYEITKDGDTYTLKTISSFRTSEISFKLNGEEFDEERMDGATAKSSVVRKGRKWIHTQKDGDRVVTIVREFKDGQIVVSGTLNGQTFVRIYKKVEAGAADDYEE